MEEETQIKFPELAEEITQMFNEDQEMRARGLAKALEGDWSDFDEEVDKRNTTRMKEIIREFGFPSIALVGKDGFNQAWHLIQHADLDPQFQERCLKLMKKLPEEELQVDMVKRCIAGTEDRVRIHKNRPQLYGTNMVWDKEKGEYDPGLVEDMEHVNERRLTMGLDTIEEAKLRLKQEYQSG